MVEVRVARLGLDSASKTYVVILQEKNGDRLLPIWIGQPEAESIVMQMNGMKRERPLTHDLCKSLIVGLGGTLRRVQITKVQKSTYYEELHVERDEQIVQIEGDPDSPVNRGRLCPKGSASKQLVTSPTRVTKVRYRRPYGTEWEDLDLDTAMEMIADRVLEARRKGWQEEDGGKRVNRTMGIASLGGATLDNEENYLMKKLYSALGAIQIENQARI